MVLDSWYAMVLDPPNLAQALLYELTHTYIHLTCALPQASCQRLGCSCYYLWRASIGWIWLVRVGSEGALPRWRPPLTLTLFVLGFVLMTWLDG